MTFWPNDILGIIGFAVGIAGFGVTWYQLFKAKKSLEIAEQARVEQNAANIRLFNAGLNLLFSSFFTELKKSVRSEDLLIASIRADDLANIIVLKVSADGEDSLNEIVSRLRGFSILFDKKHRRKDSLTPSEVKKFENICNSIDEISDRELRKSVLAKETNP